VFASRPSSASLVGPRPATGRDLEAVRDSAAASASPPSACSLPRILFGAALGACPELDRRERRSFHANPLFLSWVGPRPATGRDPEAVRDSTAASCSLPRILFGRFSGPTSGPTRPQDEGYLADRRPPTADRCVPDLPAGVHHNLQNHETDLPLTDIVEASPSLTIGFIPNGLVVRTVSGKRERFVVEGRRRWSAEISGARKRLNPS
jgi:hypothetical protein